jgi:DICT domain-containing protein
MDESLLPKLAKCTREVVNKASKPGGLLDKGEFTMAVARGLITKEMGLKDGDLDGKEWKKVVKEEVTTALVCLETSEVVRPNWRRPNEGRQVRAEG